MITVITKKEDVLCCTSYKGLRRFKRKGIKFALYIAISKIRGYKIEVVNNGWKHINNWVYDNTYYKSNNNTKN